MIAFCAECEHENEVEVIYFSRVGGFFEFEYECDMCGFTAIEESDLDV